MTPPPTIAPDSPDILTGGAWVPGKNGVLAWVPGAKAARWQVNAPRRCGSTTGYKYHQEAGERPCDLCRAAANEYRADLRSRGRARGRARGRKAAA